MARPAPHIAVTLAHKNPEHLGVTLDADGSTVDMELHWPRYNTAPDQHWI